MEGDKFILIIDDSDVIRNSLNTFCKKRGYKAVLCETMEEAEAKYKEGPEKYKAIFIDYNLDDSDLSKNGFNMADKLRAIHPIKGKLVIMSGGKFYSFYTLIDEVEEDEYKQHGFCTYMKKPVPKKAFEQLMNSFGL